MAHYTDGLTSEDMAISERVYAHPVRALVAHEDDTADYRAMLRGVRSRAECENAGCFVHCWERNAYNAALGEPL